MLVSKRILGLIWIALAVACPRSLVIDGEGSEGEGSEGEGSEGEGSEGEGSEGEGSEGEGSEGEGSEGEGECVSGLLPRFEARTPESIAALAGITYTHSLAIQSDGGDLSPLSELATGVDFVFNVTNIASISLPSLVCMGTPEPGLGNGAGIYVTTDTTTSIELPSLQEASGISLVGSTSLSVPSLTYLGSLYINGGSYTSISIPTLTHLGDLLLTNLPLLEDVDLGGVTQLCSVSIPNSVLNAGTRWVLEQMVLPPGPERDVYCAAPPVNPTCIPPAPGYTQPSCDGEGQ